MGISLSDISKLVAEVVQSVVDSVITVYIHRIELSALLLPIGVTGAGSGFIIDKRGYAVTNYHVIRGARDVRVLLPWGEETRAEVLAADRLRDIALIKVLTSTPLKPIPLGDSDKLRVGELVFVVGSPLGLPGPTATMGIVSAIGRTIRGTDEEGREVILEDLIQTDAAINPGNSGGPLINASGEAVGVTTAIIPYAQGVGFAIPINAVKSFLAMLERFGRPVIPFIGVYVTPITRELAYHYGLPTQRGLLVVRVVRGSPAYSAGIREGDLIVEVNEREVTSVRDLRKEIENSVERGYVDLRIIRDSRSYTVRCGISFIEE